MAWKPEIDIGLPKRPEQQTPSEAARVLPVCAWCIGVKRLMVAAFYTGETTDAAYTPSGFAARIVPPYFMDVQCPHCDGSGVEPEE